MNQWNMLCLCHFGPALFKILVSNWPRTPKFSQLFKNTGREDLFLPWSRVGHALRPIFMLWLVKIWQLSLCGKFMQHLEINLFTLTAEADRVLGQLVMCLICAKWNTAAIKSLLLFMAGLFICTNNKTANRKATWGLLGFWSKNLCK